MVGLRVGLRVGLLHPGEMGSRIGMALLAQGANVSWCSEGRGDDTKRRANKFDDVGSLSSLVHACDSIVSVCPPSVARSIAQSVADLGLTGFYCDANAINPDVSADIGAMVSRAGGKYVDGSIISFGGIISLRTSRSCIPGAVLPSMRWRSS
jgi:3-hydroxyisobutyrate dehydrogenase-like beta-hydroxyacid dehydrogenase